MRIAAGMLCCSLPAFFTWAQTRAVTGPGVITTRQTINVMPMGPPCCQIILFIHGAINRRAFMDGVQRFAVGGLAATTIIEASMPNYALGQQVSKTDDRIKSTYEIVPSPQGNGSIKGYLVRLVHSTARPIAFPASGPRAAGFAAVRTRAIASSKCIRAPQQDRRPGTVLDMW